MERTNFWNFKNEKEKIRQLYTEPANLVVIEFANKTDKIKHVWIEPACIALELKTETEYQIVTHDKTFRIEFDNGETMVFYLQHAFGFILNKRPVASNGLNQNEWTLEFDCSDIN